MDRAIRQVSIHGRVQGVGYRAWVDHTAQTLGLEGWVRNRRDGSVEALFAGPANIVTTMIASCQRGPSWAKVDGVTDEPAGHDAREPAAAGRGVFGAADNLTRSVFGHASRG